MQQSMFEALEARRMLSADLMVGDPAGGDFGPADFEQLVAESHQRMADHWGAYGLEVNEWGWPIYTHEYMENIGMEWVEWDGQGGWWRGEKWWVSFKETNPYDLMDDRHWTWEPADWEGRLLEMGFEFEVTNTFRHHGRGQWPGEGSVSVVFNVPEGFNPYDLMAAIHEAGYGSYLSQTSPDWSFFLLESVVPGKPEGWTPRWSEPVEAKPTAEEVTIPAAVVDAAFAVQPIAAASLGVNDLLAEESDLLGGERPVLG